LFDVLIEGEKQAPGEEDTAMPQTSELPKSMTGADLAAVGVFAFDYNLHGSAEEMCRFLGAACCDAPGAFPTMILAASRVMHAYASSHQRFVEIFIQHVLLSCWPLAPIAVGTVLFDVQLETRFRQLGFEQIMALVQ
jgi:hypothetical protein